MAKKGRSEDQILRAVLSTPQGMSGGTLSEVCIALSLGPGLGFTMSEARRQ